MRRLGKTRPFLDADGHAAPGSIAEVKYLPLGGMEQWVLIRGESRDNPPLILLQGGPGLSETRLFRRFLAPLEKSFTVVYWDQRGSGKSFNRRMPRSAMTVDQFLADLDDLVEAVRHRTKRSKVTIFGHSWGSALGVLYAARFPQKVSAYVGSGQIGDWPAGERASYAFVLERAECVGNRKALRELRAIGPPPHTAENLWIQRKWLQRLEGRLGPRSVLELTRILLGGRPETSALDLPNMLRGFRFSLDAMWTEVSNLNLVQSVPILQVPVFFFLGRNDHWVSPDVSLAYFEVLTAPSKRLVWFENSGHEPFWDEPLKFNTLMVDLVRPVAAEI